MIKNKMPIIKTEYGKYIDNITVLVVLSTMAIYYYGTRVLVIIGYSLVLCLLVDKIINVCRKVSSSRENTAFVITIALTISLMMTAVASIYVITLTCLFAIIIGKHAFGDRENIIAYPTSIAMLFASLSFKQELFYNVKVFDYLPVSYKYSSQTELFELTSMSNLTNEFADITVIDVIAGKAISPIGTGCAVILLVAALFLIFRKSISGITFLTVTGILFLFGYFYYGNDVSSAINMISLNSMLFGIIFFGCNFLIVPKSKISQFIYGVLLAAFILLFSFVIIAPIPIINAVILTAPFSYRLNSNDTNIVNKIIEKRQVKFHKTKVED